MQSTRGRFALVGMFGLALVASAFGQSLVVQHGQVVAATAGPVPGVPGASFGGSSTFDLPVMDETGRVLFRGRFIGGGATALTDRALFLGYTAADLALFVRGGDPAPGLPGGYTLNTGTIQGLGGNPRQSSNGNLFFCSNFTGPGVLTTNDSGIFGGTAGSWTLLVREGDPAPGTLGATLGSGFGNLSTQPTGMNTTGRVLFQSSTLGGDTVTANNAGWFTGLPGALELVQRKGDVVLGGTVISALGFVSQMNASGQVIHDEQLSTTLGTTPATAANDRSLWIWTPGVGNILVLREGDPAPGTAGATFNVTSNSWFISVSANCFNAAGKFFTHCDLLNGDVVGTTNDRALYLGDTSGMTMYMRRGDPAPGLPGLTIDVVSTATMNLNNNDDVCFGSTLLGPGVVSTNDSALFVGQPGNYVVAAREGDPAPGTVGAVFGQFTSMQTLLNDKGQVVISVDLLGGDVVFGTNDRSYYGYDPVMGMQLIWRGNDQVEVFPGTFRNIATIGAMQFNNGSAASLGFNHDGDLAIRANMFDSTAAIIRCRLGSLVGYPEQISGSAGGVQRLHLNAGIASAGLTYLVAGSVTGTTPGIPAGLFTVPLNPDDYFLYTLTFPNVFPLGNTLGTLSANGQSSAPTLTLPAGLGALAGLTINHAFAALDIASNILFVSEAAPLLVTP